MKRRYRRKRRWGAKRSFSTPAPVFIPPPFEESHDLQSKRAHSKKLNDELDAFTTKKDKYIFYIVIAAWLGIGYLLFVNSSKRTLDSYLGGWLVSWWVLSLSVPSILEWILQLIGYGAEERRKAVTLKALDQEVDLIFGQEKSRWEEKVANLRRTAEIESQRRLDERRQKELRVDKLDPFEFERMLAEKFQELGYEVKLTSKTGDGGVDLWLGMHSKKIAVQCKRYAKDSPVSRPDIQKFIGAIITERADEGVFITTSFFTDGARKASSASPYRIKLMERDEVFSFLGL